MDDNVVRLPSISRERYVVMDSYGRIFCGLARTYEFKLINDIGNTAFKTYVSEKKAKSSFINSWYGSKEEDFENGTYKILRVVESLTFI